jgi:Flp pilus assembly secretin CpaC
MSGTSMHRPLRLAILFLLATPLAAQAAVTVPLDQTRRVSFGGAAANIVVGNPDIADVNVIDARNLMVVGKRFGVTNLVVLDVDGRTLFDSEIVVSAGSGSMVSVTRGVQNFDYACTPNCQQVAGEAPTVLTPPAASAAAPAPAPAAPAAPAP